MFNRVILAVLILLVGLLVWQVSMRESEQPQVEQEIIDIVEPVAQPEPVELPNFAAYQDVNQKKQAFVDFLMPAIEQANRAIEQERAFLLSLDLTRLSANDKQNLTELGEKYKQARQPKQSLQSWRRQLLKKVDIIPPSLALAQAANESAWGTSRFARKGFNFYGQWCFSEGCGLVPKGRPEGEGYEVRVFNTPQESVEAYMLNLNAFHTYQPLRQIRLTLREQDKAILGTRLAPGLLAYSQRREEYIEEIRNMIEYNEWLTYDWQWVENRNAASTE